jgi:Uri superfamily endonuclease
MTKGIYILVVSVSKDINVNVGALGSVNFEKDLYAYVGSAQNNLEKRIERHLRKTKQKFWHIDYLSQRFNFALSQLNCKGYPVEGTFCPVC